MASPLSLPDLLDHPPAGPNLELDTVFGEMERAAQGKAEGQFGNTVEPATPPDWKEAAALAAALLDRTRDLRVMVMLAIAQLNLHDLPAFAAALSTVRQHIETMWDHVHPQLDPEDDNDPLLRSNALLLLAHPGRVLRPLRDVPLAAPPRARPVTWRDIAILNGAIEAEPGREKLSEAAIRGAFAATPPAQLAALRAAVESARDDLAAIPPAFEVHSGPGHAPDFKELPRLVRDIHKEVERYAALATAGLEPEEDVGAALNAATPDPDRPASAGRSVMSVQSIVAINNRDDALHALELASSYFRNHEPSSPLPLLIDRARRLAPMPFLDIVRDLAPDGLMQALNIAGTTSDQE